MAKTISDAWVAVKASGETFGEDVSRIVKAGTAGVKADIPVTADTKRAVTDIDGLKVKLADITARASVIKLDADDKTAQAKLLDIQSRLDKYAKRIATAKADVDIRPLLAGVIRADAALDALGRKKVTPTVDPNKPGVPNVPGGGGGAAGAAADSAGLVNPGTIAAGLAALPFAAQAAGIGITTALGGALAGIAIYAASKSADVRQTFLTLKQNVNHDLTGIGAPFIPVLESIARTATSVFNGLAPIFAGATGAIAGPFKTFADTLLRSFGSPAVQTSIAHVAASFGQLLTAATPALAGAVTNVATGVQKLADAVAGNPGAFRDLISDMGKLAGGVLTVIASMTQVANWVEKNWNWVKWIVVPEVAAIQEVVANFDTLRHDIAAHMSEIQSNVIDAWNKTWTQTIGRAVQFGHDLEDDFNNVKSWITTWVSAVGKFFTSTLPNDWKAAVTSAKNDFVAPIENAFTAAVSWINTNLVGKLTNFLTKVIPADFKAAVQSAKNDFISPIEGAFSGAVSWINTNLVGRLTTFMTVTIPNDFKSAVTAAKNDFVTPIENAFSGAWTWITGHFITPIHTFLVTTLPADFRSAVSAVSSAWTGVENAVSVPVKFVVNNVIDKLISAFDTVSKAVGGPSIPQVKFAGGGQVPGHGSGDTVHAMLTPGELVVPVGMVRAGAVDHLRGMLPGFAAGGTVPGGGQSVHTGTTAVPTGDPLSGVLSKLGDAAKLAADLATGNTTASINAFTALIGGGVGGATGDLATVLTDVPKTLVKEAVSFLSGLASKAAAAASANGGPGAGPGSSNYSADISAVLKALGLPASLLSNWLRQIATESGGQLDAVNRTDSNAQAGHPSVGLLQLIPGTFAAYAGPYRNTPPLVNYGGGTVSENAMAQIYAAINYAKSRYGSSMADVIGQGHGYALGGRVFDQGGTLPPGPSMVWNRTGANEQLANVTGGGGRAYASTPGHVPPMSAESAAILDRLDRLIAVSGQQGGQFANAINGASGGAALRGRYSTRRG